MPDTLVRRFGGEPKTWVIYTKEEADAEGIQYKHWKEATSNEWALTDDGYVCQVVRKTGPHKEKARNLERYNVTLPFCRRWVGTQELNYEEYRRSDMRPWLRDELATSRFKRALRLYASLILEKGFPLSEADMDAVGLAYRPKSKIPSANFKRVMRYSHAKEMLAKELESILLDQGVSKTRVVEMYNEAFTEAKNTRNAAAMRSVAKDLADMLDMKPDRRSENEIAVTGLDWRALESADDDDDDSSTLEIGE